MRFSGILEYTADPSVERERRMRERIYRVDRQMKQTIVNVTTADGNFGEPDNGRDFAVNSIGERFTRSLTALGMWRSRLSGTEYRHY